MRRFLFLAVCVFLLGVNVSGSDAIAGMSGSGTIQQPASNTLEGETAMRIIVKANGNDIVFELNGSTAARELLAQLPLGVDVENYGNNEKIFYLPKKLKTSDTPLVSSARPGTLAYYAPWGDVVLFYGSFGSAPGLHELGQAVSGIEHIRGMSGTVRIEK